jgi:hypothetical protein
MIVVALRQTWERHRRLQDNTGKKIASIYIPSPPLCHGGIIFSSFHISTLVLEDSLQRFVHFRIPYIFDFPFVYLVL